MWSKDRTQARRFRKCCECGATFRTVQESEKVDNEGDLWVDKARRYRASFTEEQVRDMREAYSYGLTQEVLAKKFNCKVLTVRRIIQRKTWAHIE